MLAAVVHSLSLSSWLEKPETVDEMALQYLPYDLLLNIASYLNLYDVHALHLVSCHNQRRVRSESEHFFRPVKPYMNFQPLDQFTESWRMICSVDVALFL